MKVLWVIVTVPLVPEQPLGVWDGKGPPLLSGPGPATIFPGKRHDCPGSQHTLGHDTSQQTEKPGCVVGS